MNFLEFNKQQQLDTCSSKVDTSRPQFKAAEQTGPFHNYMYFIFDHVTTGWNFLHTNTKNEFVFSSHGHE